MGKRELLIIAACAVLGVLAFELTAAPASGTRRPFSLSTLVDNWRRQARGSRTSVQVSHADTIPAPDSLSDLRISGVPDVTVIGEARSDVTYELAVTGSGADDAGARDVAARTTLERDDLGGILVLRLRPAPDGRQTSAVTLRVPARLAVRISGARMTHVTGVSAVHLDATIGEAAIRQVTGVVDGSHRNGRLAIEDAGSATIAVMSATTSLLRIGGRVSLTARNGECDLTDAGGAIDADVTNGKITVTGARQGMTLTATNAQAIVTAPRGDVKIDARRTSVMLTLTTPVAVAILTTDEPLRVKLPATFDAAIDAVAGEKGTIDASDFGLTPSRDGVETRLAHTFGGGRLRVALRNTRGAIVISETK